MPIICFSRPKLKSPINLKHLLALIMKLESLPMILSCLFSIELVVPHYPWGIVSRTPSSAPKSLDAWVLNIKWHGGGSCLLTCVWLFVIPWIVAHLAAFSLGNKWDFYGKNTGVGCHLFLQGIFPTRKSSQLRDQTHVSCIAGRPFATEPPGAP